ncbi:MAG TPA: hypothetical protein VEC36_04900 [Patescibacteria group bacterium]|nr:hypothetical protein [Patescibacteria group bacterium]
MKYLLLAVIFISATSLFAQSADPLNPGRVLYPEQAGLIGGVGILTQTGEFNVTCDCPAFDGGRGTGFLIGAIYERDLFRQVAWGAALLYQHRPFEALYRETELVPVRSAETERNYEAPLDFRNTASARFSYLTLMPFIKYIQFQPLFLRGGIGLTTIVSGNLLHSKELLTKTVRSPEGRLETVSMVDENGQPRENLAIIEDNEFPALNAFQLSLEPAIGVDIKLGKSSWYLAPVFQYSLPLTIISENGNNFKLSAWQITGEIRYIF